MSRMDETLYSLMHQDDPVCAISIDTVSGAILRVSKPVNPELLPLVEVSIPSCSRSGGSIVRYLLGKERFSASWSR